MHWSHVFGILIIEFTYEPTNSTKLEQNLLTLTEIYHTEPNVSLYYFLLLTGPLWKKINCQQNMVPQPLFNINTVIKELRGFWSDLYSTERYAVGMWLWYSISRQSKKRKSYMFWRWVQWFNKIFRSCFASS